jgi:hypothetical protein
MRVRSKHRICCRDGEKLDYFEGPPKKRLHLEHDLAEEEEEEEEEKEEEEEEEEEEAAKGERKVAEGGEEEREAAEEEGEEEEGGEERGRKEGEGEKGKEKAVTTTDPAGAVQWTYGHPPTPEPEILTRIAELANLSSSVHMKSIENLLGMIQVPTTFVPACSRDLSLHALIKKCRSNVDSCHYVSFVSMVDNIKLAFHLAK